MDLEGKHTGTDFAVTKLVLAFDGELEVVFDFSDSAYCVGDGLRGDPAPTIVKFTGLARNPSRANITSILRQRVRVETIPNPFSKSFRAIG